jgi:tRNA 2-thiouridine synthesizing protein A
MSVLAISHYVDARGLEMPAPTARAEQALRGLPSGEIIEVLTTDPRSVFGFSRWSEATGHELLDAGVNGRIYRFVVRRR